jgi:hypothetical protein
MVDEHPADWRPVGTGPRGDEGDGMSHVQWTRRARLGAVGHIADKGEWGTQVADRCDRWMIGMTLLNGGPSRLGFVD